jgi:hypothetical protein
MRRAYNDYGLIIIDDVFIGISLGYDFTAEHEWGIKGINRICAIPESSKKNMGVKNRTITKSPKIVFKEKTHKKVKFALLYTGTEWRSDEENEKYVPRDLENYVSDLEWKVDFEQKHPNDKGNIKDNIITAWDENSFGVGVMGEKEVEYLKEIKTALENCNLTITRINIQPTNPFANASLSLLITDRIPKEALEQMYLADKEYYDREDYEKKIGMKKILEKYGNKNGYKNKNYFCACSPKWIDYDDAENREEIKKKYNTKYDIIYWVNYSDDDNNYGYYSVEEIREWLKGKKKLTEIRKAN